MWGNDAQCVASDPSQTQVMQFNRNGCLPICSMNKVYGMQSTQCSWHRHLQEWDKRVPFHKMRRFLHMHSIIPKQPLLDWEMSKGWHKKQQTQSLLWCPILKNSEEMFGYSTVTKNPWMEIKAYLLALSRRSLVIPSSQGALHFHLNLLSVSTFGSFMGGIWAQNFARRIGPIKFCWRRGILLTQVVSRSTFQPNQYTVSVFLESCLHGFDFWGLNRVLENVILIFSLFVYRDIAERKRKQTLQEALGLLSWIYILRRTGRSIRITGGEKHKCTRALAKDIRAFCLISRSIQAGDGRVVW